MKTPITIAKTLLLTCVVFISIQGTSPGKNAKNNTTKSPVTTINNQQSISLLSGIQRLFDGIEQNIVSTADAMPEDKFYFTPEAQNIKGSEFKGVRTFAGQIKHLATDNFDIWSPLTGDPIPEGIKDVNGPENIKTKADIMQYLKASFAEGRKAIATLTDKNAMEMIPFRGRNLARLDLAFYALTHANEHYGQMVVYLRMSGSIPPASMPVKK